jgi:Leucine-rich repeat (LRR) protein
MRAACTAVLLFACAAISGADNTPTADEQKAIDAVAKAGGKATIDPKLPPQARVSVEFDSVTNTVLVGLKKYPQIGEIVVADAAKCTDQGYVAFKSLPHLRKLVLGKSKLTPACTSAIGQCKELRYLGLVDAGLDDTELVAFRKLTLLEHLSLSDNAKITDKGMLTVKTFERLQSLYLANTSVGDKGLAELKGLDGLRTLNLTNTKVTAAAAAKFPEDMPNLRGVRH